MRELRNAIERAVILSEGGMLTAEHLPIGIAAAKPAMPIVRIAAPQSLGDAERQMIEEALERAGRNKSEAARLLGITRAQLRSRIEKHGLALSVGDGSPIGDFQPPSLRARVTRAIRTQSHQALTHWHARVR